MSEHPTLSEFTTQQATDSRPASQPSTEETVTMTADERVATYLIEDQMADLTDAIREAVQNGIDSPGSSRVLVSISPERSLILDDGTGINLESTEGRHNLSVLGAGSKQRSDDETIGEWSIDKGAIIAKGVVRIWSHDTALCFGSSPRLICDYARNGHMTHEEARTLLTTISPHRSWGTSPYVAQLRDCLESELDRIGRRIRAKRDGCADTI